jgi:hypothetical protein
MEQQHGIVRRNSDVRRDPAPIWVLAFTLLLSGISTAPVRTTSSARVVIKDDQQLTEYRALRRMHAKSDRFNHEGWLEAWTELDNEEFRYRIVSERGSDYLRNKVLRAVLQREQELIAAGRADRVALTEENYEFSGEETAHDGYRYVQIKPRRKEVTLVDGRMVLSPEGDLLRVEGRLAKNPSFWTSQVNVIRHFATIDGVRVPVSTESIAKVKFAGESRLDIFNDYESINGRSVSVSDRKTLASASRRTDIPD